MTTLKQRIEQAKKEMESYPGWVRDNSVFQGGETSEFRSTTFTEPQPAEPKKFEGK